MEKVKNTKSVILRIIAHIIGLGAVLAVTALALFYIKYSFVDTATVKNEYRYINDIYDSPAVEFSHGKTLEQQFTTHGDIYGVKIRFHNLGVPQAGSAYMELVEAEKDMVVASTTFNTEIMVNDVYTDIFFDTPYRVGDYFQKEEGSHDYILRITPDFANGDEAYMKVWGDSKTKTMAFGVLTYRVKSESLYGWFRLISIVAMAAALVLYAVCFIFKFRKEVVFVTALFAVSCLFTLALPPFSSPDEEAHINTAYRLCNEKFEGYTKADLAERTIQRRAEDYSKTFENKKTDVFSYEYIYDNLTSKVQKEGIKPISNVWAVSDFDGVYMMGALGIKVSHVLGLGYVPSMYLGRLFNLLFFALCLFFAIKITPVGKNVFMALSFFPITLHLVNSFSRDVFVISLGFLFTAYLLYLLKQEETYKWWQLVLLAVISILLAPSKFIYCTLCIAILLLDIRKVPLLNRIKIKMNPLWAILGAGVLGVCGLGVMYVATPWIFKQFAGRIFSSESLETLLLTNPDATFNIGLMLQNPVVALKLILATIFENGAYYIKSVAGGVLGYNSVIISDAFIIVVLVCAVMATFTEDCDSYTLRKRDRGMFGFISLVILALVVYLGISWTPVSYSTIYGIQGKYLLPVLPMALLALKGKAFAVKKDIFRPICFVMGCTNLFVALNAIAVILQR